MTDSYTKVTHTGYLGRIGNSLKGVLFGLLLFFLSFWVLYWNEGKVNLAEVAKTSIEITDTTENLTDLQGKLVSIHGTLKAHSKIGDTYLKPGNYISVKRKVEMYAWEETTREVTEKDFGGGETTTTKYEYSEKWTETPESSSSFEYPAGHTNPEKSIESTKIVAKDLQIENFNVHQNIELPVGLHLILTEENTLVPEGIEKEGDYLFKSFSGNSSIDSPQIGDIRITYATLNNPMKNTTVFGKLENANTLSTFIGPKDSQLYRVLEGDREEAIATLQLEHDVLTWVLRGVGFFMMFFGLVLILTPLSVVLDIIPFVGTLGEWAIKIVAFIIAFILSAITIIISMIIHNIWALILVILLAIGGIFYLWKKKKALPVKSESVEK